MSTKSLITEEMKSMVGSVLRVWTSGEELSRSDIRRYTQAVMDDNPLYCDDEYANKTRFGGIVAPGVFPTRYLRQLTGSTDPMRDASPDWDGSLPGGSVAMFAKLWPEDRHEFNAGSELQVFQHAQPGDIVSVKDILVDVYERTSKRGTVGYFIIETIYTNQRGEILCIDRQTHAMR